MVKRCEYVVRNMSLTTIQGIKIIVDTDEWFEFVDSINSFHYVYRQGKEFTVSKMQRRRVNYWHAQKTFLGQKRSLYIGKTENLTSERLIRIAEKINAPVSMWRLI